MFILQLAVLGACKCRVTSPEPCGCAHAAAALRRELCKLKEQVLWISNTECVTTMYVLKTIRGYLWQEVDTLWITKEIIQSVLAFCTELITGSVIGYM